MQTISLYQAVTLAAYIAAPALFIVAAGAIADIATRVETRLSRRN